MSELRDDSLTGVRVIVAPGRSTRPDTFRAQAPLSPAAVASCPFCAGNEHETPPEVARTGSGQPDTPGWRVRVVPNKYPIVGEGLAGTHEVIVLSPAHNRSFADLDPDAAREVLLVVRDRAATHLMAGCTHAQVFVNHGRAAGASIEHPHAQVLALDFVPPFVELVLDRFAKARRDLTADAIDEARQDAGLVRDDGATIWCPPASIGAYSVRMALEGAGARFDLAPDTDIATIATALQWLLGALRRVLGDVPYNVVVNSAPRDEPRPFHWWVDVVPRLTVTAGFEFGTGLHVCTVEPDAAAAALLDAS
jgi:UDPglucose--hexose-1-phosphate uridylyltransferase